jgi:5-methylcytosine-specific restriction protein A
MPYAPARPCTSPRCPHPAVSHGRCAQHAVPAWAPRVVPVRRITGRPLQRLRARLFTQQPLCVQCQAEGRVTIATIRDHRIPLTEGGQDTDANVQPLCETCHDAKTLEERKRGLTRSRIPVK